MSRATTAVAVLFTALSVATLGCASPDAASPESTAAETAGTSKDSPDHAGWWCDEHGLPEAVCDQCSKKYREAEKAKGNWCEHDRVKSSCFQCNPGLKEKYAAEYKAKFGKEPPATEDDEKKDDGKGKDKK